jgi:5-methylcytosine-specific restriction protein B
LKNPDVFDLDSLAIMKRMLDFGGAATCKQLSQKYGASIAFYNFGSVRLAKRILKETNTISS